MTAESELPVAVDSGPTKGEGIALMVLGALLVVLGIVLVANPFAALWILALMIAFSLVLGGVAEVISGRQTDMPAWVVWGSGAVIVIAGLVAVIWPAATLWVLAMVAGLGLIFLGCVGVSGALVYDTDDRWIRLGLAALTLLIGVLVIAWPQATLLVLAVLIGIRTIINGIFAVAVGSGLYREAKAS